MEKLIYGKSGSKILTEQKVLWSAMMSTGIQYNFSKNVSLYCKPYCSYLLSDTALMSYRKDDHLAYQQVLDSE